MAEELRLAFILLGSLAIGAVILHGVWTVRKAVNEERKLTKQAKRPEPEMDMEIVDEEVQSLKLKQMEMDFAELQAEENGLPVVNMDVDSIYKDDNVSANTQSNLADTETANNAGTMTDGGVMAQGAGAEITPQNELFAKDNQTSTASFGDAVESSLTVADKNAEPQLGEWSEQDDTPVIGDVSASHLDDEKGPAFNASTDLDEASSSDTQQYEPKFESPVSHQKPMTAKRHETTPNSHEPAAKAQEKPATEAPQQVLMLFVDKSEGDEIEGAKLLPLLLTLGFKFGEMDFFHRHVHNSGQGEILFSLANMFNPGTFDPDKMEQFSTRGLTIFMTLPNALEPLQTFNMMHNAAKKIADEFGAKVLDEQRRPLDVSIVRGYVERIRKFKA